MHLKITDIFYGQHNKVKIRFIVTNLLFDPV